MALETHDNVIVTSLDALANWCRKNSLCHAFATACCGIELMATVRVVMIWRDSVRRPCASVRGRAT